MNLELTLTVFFLVFMIPTYSHTGQKKNNFLFVKDKYDNIDSSPVQKRLRVEIRTHLFPWTWEAQNAKL